MKYPNYIRLNESGKPMALPWIEQEELLQTEMFSDISFDDVMGYLITVEDSEIVDNIRKLYKSPFDPERDLVGDKALFAGWAVGKLGDCYQVADTYRFTISRETNRRTSYWSYPTKSGGYCIGPPQTLSDFIDDCHRAGVELEWTPYAIQQMTGEAQQ